MNPQNLKRIYSIGEIFAIAGFIFGFFFNIPILAIITGLLLVIDDIFEMMSGRLKPLFPIIFAIILAMIIKPWYYGIFWSVIAFKILNIPQDIRVIFAPQKYKSIKEVEEENL